MRTETFLFKCLRKLGLAMAKHFLWVRKLRYTYWKVQKKRYSKLAKRATPNPHSVMFEAFGGRKYTCSPKAIYEAMCADPRFDGWTFYWSFKGQVRSDEHRQLPALSRATVVKRGSKEFFDAFATSAYWVQNSRAAEYIVPRPDQVYVQCWHGTPLKRLGLDVPETTAGGALNTAHELADRFQLDAAKWTYLLSPSPYTSRHLCDAFGVDYARRDSTVIEEGYPRNDSIRRTLDAPDAASRIAALKDLIGIPHNRKVLLFAPTWRDDQYTSGVGYTLGPLADFDALREVLGGEWIVLLRTHYYIANKLDLSSWEGFVFNVSKHEEINDLYLVSDALCTDYSSVFYDFANTGRPIYFFWPDREHYEKELHGFYVDADTLPGPKCATSAELAIAVAANDSWDAKYGKAYRAFIGTYCPKDDGHAAERVIERVFGPVLGE